MQTRDCLHKNLSEISCLKCLYCTTISYNQYYYGTANVRLCSTRKKITSKTEMTLIISNDLYWRFASEDLIHVSTTAIEVFCSKTLTFDILADKVNLYLFGEKIISSTYRF